MTGGELCGYAPHSRMIEELNICTSGEVFSTPMAGLELSEAAEVSLPSPRSPKEEAGPLKGSPVSVRPRPGAHLRPALGPAKMRLPPVAVGPGRAPAGLVAAS